MSAPSSPASVTTPSLFGSTSPPAPSSTGDSGGSGFGNNGLGAASYYGAVAVVVFVLIVVTLVSRLLYTRRMRRARAERQAAQAARDEEERAGMQRRGEAGGLPTYRESSYASAPVRPPPAAHTTHDETVAPPPYRPPPPKYEDEDEDEDEVAAAAATEGASGGTRTELGQGGQARDASSVIEEPQGEAMEMAEMRPSDAGEPTERQEEGRDDDAAAYERRTRDSTHAALADGVAPRAPEPSPDRSGPGAGVSAPLDRPLGPSSAGGEERSAVGDGEQSGERRGWGATFGRILRR